MRNILISIFSLLILACNSNTDEKSKAVETTDSSTVSPKITNSERFVSEHKETEMFDTLIADKQLKVTITRRELDSYVVHEYEEAGVRGTDKYRDAEIALVVKQASETLLDTVFRKEQFSKYREEGFMEIAIFHNYWFEKLDENRVELSGVISKPETCWAIGFHHYFDLTTNKLTFEEEKSIDD